MAVLHTIASSGDDGAEASNDSSVTQEHVEQVDASSDELEILEAESVAAAAAVASADARLRFLRARRTSAQVPQASAKSASSAPGPAVRPLWLPAVEDLPDRGPLATVSLAPPVVRRAAEPAHRTAFRQQEMREERWEKERRDRERQVRRRATDVPYHLSGQRVLEASGIDFAGNVVIPELPPMPVATTPAVPPANIVLLPLREEHVRDRVHDLAPDVVPDPVLHDPEPAPSDRSSVVARLRQRISELESVRLRQRIAELESTRLRQRTSELDNKFEDGVSIPVPDNSSSYATVSSASPLPARVELPPSLAALPQVQSHDHGQGLPPPPVPIDADLDDSGDDGPLHITYTGAAQRLSRTAPADPHGDPSSSSSYTSSSSSDRVRKKKKKKSKFKKEKSPSRSSSVRRVVRVKATDMKLGQWPTTLQFAGWRRALRLAVAGSCDEPDMAKKWIFAVEDKDSDIDDFKSDPNDPLRALDGKLADALARIAKGEPARRIALEAERAALSADLLSGRQTLWMIYKEFERDDATTDHIAYGHLERMTFSGKDEHLEAFVNSWDALMLTFKTKPSESHLYSALMSRLKKLPGLATTVAHMDRQVNGHPDRCFDFLMHAARRLVENRRNERQEHELNKLFAAGSNASPALPAGQKGAGKGKDKKAGTGVKIDRKTMPCFKMRDTGNCPDGDKCEYSHKKDIIDAAKEKKKNGKGKGKDKKGGTGKGKVKQICRDFNTPGKGCLRGSSCHFLHEQPAMAAAPVASAPASAVAGQ